MQRLLIPPPVPPDGHIRVVSPGSASLALLPLRTARALEALRELGYRVSLGRHAAAVSEDGRLAGAAADRAADVMEAFADPDVDAVLSADAGEGSSELLAHFEPSVFTTNPKYFIGYCDNVHVNQFLLNENIASLYGTTLLGHLGDRGGPFPHTVSSLQRALSNEAPLTVRPVPARTAEHLDWAADEFRPRARALAASPGWTWVRPGSGRGRFVGGELRTLAESAFAVDLERAVLFWHLAFDAPRAEALFARLAHGHDLNALSGMVVGAHPDVPPAAWSSLVADLVDAYLPDACFPVAVNVDVSHLDPGWTVPYGEEAVLMSDDDAVVFPRGAHL